LRRLEEARTVQRTKFELVINLKTAMTLRLENSPMPFLLAEDVIGFRYTKATTNVATVRLEKANIV
jgi:hypothetical protein